MYIVLELWISRGLNLTIRGSVMLAGSQYPSFAHAPKCPSEHCCGSFWLEIVATHRIDSTISDSGPCPVTFSVPTRGKTRQNMDSAFF
jgi:hypothetical protein